MAQRLTGRVTALSSGGSDDLSKAGQDSISVGFDGIDGDSHAGASREAYDGDREPKGTCIRNDRQWSAVSTEELDEISRALDLAEPLTASTVGANLCLEGIPELSLLPRGSRLKFPSGAALIVEEYNPPCMDMGAVLVKKHRRRDGSELQSRDWLKPASGRRGIVGMIDVAGSIAIGDSVEVTVFKEPPIRRWPIEEA